MRRVYRVACNYAWILPQKLDPAFECPKVKFQDINRFIRSWSSWGKLSGADRGVTQVPQPSWLHSCHPDGGCGHHKQVLQYCPGHYIPRPSPTNHPVASHALNMRLKNCLPDGCSLAARAVSHTGVLCSIAGFLLLCDPSYQICLVSTSLQKKFIC